jgi:hypothetical protein
MVGNAAADGVLETVGSEAAPGEPVVAAVEAAHGIGQRCVVEPWDLADPGVGAQPFNAVGAQTTGAVAERRAQRCQAIACTAAYGVVGKVEWYHGAVFSGGVRSLPEGLMD